MILLIFTLLNVNLMANDEQLIAASKTNTQILNFALVPQQSASKLAKKWIPIFNYLSTKTGIKLNFMTAPNIPAFEKRLAKGEYDIAYMNPYHFTIFNQSPGYQAFAKAKNKRIKGILVTKKTTPIESLISLNNKTLAFPAPAAFAATLLTQATLKQNQVNFKAQYVSSHDSVYHSVARGLFPAGGGVMRTFGNVEPDIQKQLKILYTTDGFTPHAFAAHPRIDKRIIQKLQQAMLAMDKDPDGQQLLQSINIKGIESASNSHWDDVRALDIKVQLEN